MLQGSHVSCKDSNSDIAWIQKIIDWEEERQEEDGIVRYRRKWKRSRRRRKKDGSCDVDDKNDSDYDLYAIQKDVDEGEKNKKNENFFAIYTIPGCGCTFLVHYL